jgi:hypothetical protein
VEAELLLKEPVLTFEGETELEQIKVALHEARVVLVLKGSGRRATRLEFEAKVAVEELHPGVRARRPPSRAARGRLVLFLVGLSP